MDTTFLGGQVITRWCMRVAAGSLFVYAAAVVTGLLFHRHPAALLLVAYSGFRAIAAATVGFGLWRLAPWARWAGLGFSILLGAAGLLTLRILRRPSAALPVHFSALSVTIQYIATPALLIAAVALLVSLVATRPTRPATQAT